MDSRVKSAPPNCAMTMLTLVLIIFGIAFAIVIFYRIRARRAWERARAHAMWLNRELEQPDSRVEVVEIWSDEQLERNNAQLANEILTKVGHDLSADGSVEGKRLCAFLATIHPPIANSVQTPRDIGIAWFSCMQLQDNEPASEVAQVFKELNDAWTATREEPTQKMILASKTIPRGSATRLMHSDTQS